jgi:hypothetical protein
MSVRQNERLGDSIKQNKGAKSIVEIQRSDQDEPLCAGKLKLIYERWDKLKIFIPAALGVLLPALWPFNKMPFDFVGLLSHTSCMGEGEKK